MIKVFFKINCICPFFDVVDILLKPHVNQKLAKCEKLGIYLHSLYGNLKLLIHYQRAYKYKFIAKRMVEIAPGSSE